jgi:hypothetical protein
VKGTRVAINLPATFTYNPQTYKVSVTHIMKNTENEFGLDEQVTVEYTPDEILGSFEFIGNEEWDASDRVWED